MSRRSAWAMVGLLLGGCGPASSASDIAAPSNVGPAPTGGAAAAHAAIGSVEELEQIGAALVAGGERGLVRRADPRFAAFVGVEPRRIALSEAPLAERMEAVLQMQEVVRTTLKTYLAATRDDPTLIAECASLLSVSLGVARPMWSVNDAFWAALPDPDPAMRVRLEGHRALQEGTDSMLTGTILVLSDPALDPAARDAVTAALAAHTRVLLRRLQPSQRARVVGAIGELAARSADPTASALRRLHEEADAPDVWITTRGVVVARDGETLIPRAADGSKGFDASQKRSGPNDLLLVGLRAWALARRDALEGAAVLSVEPGVTYRELIEVLFTLGQSEVAAYALRQSDAARELWTYPPQIGGGHLDPEPSALRLSMWVVGEGIALKTSGGNIAPGCREVGAGLAIPRAAQGVNEAALGACLARLKEDFPSDWSLTAVANPSVRFGSVLDAVVVAQGTPERPLFPRIFFGVAR